MTTGRQKISIVVPLYNEAETLPALMARLAALVQAQHTFDWEVVCVNDGSFDATADALDRLSDTHGWLAVVHLSRNFGHQIAISAGMDFAHGDAVIIMDGDLQDPPELIPDLIAQWQAGYEVVYATRKIRHGESWLKIWTAKLFYRFLQKLSDVYIPLDTGDFRLMSRPVVNALGQMREKNRFVRGMVSWLGFRQTSVMYEREKRHAGETGYTLFKMLRFALDGLIAFSTVPLQWITTLGYCFALSSFVGIGIVVYLKYSGQVYIEPGWPSVMIGLLLLGGIQLICLGMLGEYIGRIFDEVRGRPLYVVGRHSKVTK